jgi:hypothetical protein
VNFLNPSRGMRAFLASLPPLTAFALLMRAFDVSDRLSFPAALLLGVVLGTVALQWGFLFTRGARRAEVR